MLRSSIAWSLVFFAAAGCSPSTGASPDAGSDGGAVDVGALRDAVSDSARDLGLPVIDTGALDTGADTGAPEHDAFVAPHDAFRTDAGGAHCADAIDLAVAGTRLPNGSLHWEGDNSSAGTSTEVPQLRGACGTGGTLARDHEMLFTYTVATESYLKVNTSIPATGHVNVTPWVLDGCAPDAMQLSCDIDNGGSRGLALTEHPLPAGTVVTIVIGGFEFAGTGASAGPVAFDVTELVPLPVDAPCNDLSVDAVCVDGAHCEPISHTSDMGGQCFEDGTHVNAQCRFTPPYCDPPLQCAVDMPGPALPGFCM